MNILSKIFVGLVAIIHLYILILEMFLFDGPIGQRTFGITPEESATMAVLAMNQGLYNGFLAAGLIWGLVKDRFDIKVFFLSCVIIAGIFGALTAKETILYTQAMPALIALIFCFVAQRKVQ